MRARLPIVAVTVLGFAEPAAACGGCFDLNLQRWWWGAPALGILAALLLGEVVISGVVWRVMGHAPRVRRAGRTVFALVLGIGAGMLIGGSVMALALGMLLVLVPSFVQSLVREMPGASRAAILRPVGVVVALVASSAGLELLPSQWETASLIDLSVSVTGRPAPDGWIHDELRKRPDADAQLDARLLPTTRLSDIFRLLRLHEELTPAEHHSVVCARVIAQTPEELRAPVQAACAAP